MPTYFSQEAPVAGPFATGTLTLVVWFVSTSLNNSLGPELTRKIVLPVSVLAVAFIYVTYTDPNKPTSQKWVEAIVNGIVVYLAAVGGNTVASSVAESKSRGLLDPTKINRWFK